MFHYNVNWDLPQDLLTVWVLEMMVRSKPSTFTVGEVIAKSKTNNLKMISQAKSTGEIDLDKLAWKKTKGERDRGIAHVVKMFQGLIMFGEDVVVAVRRAILERHGAEPMLYPLVQKTCARVVGTN